MARILDLGPVAQVEMNSGKVFKVEGKQIAVFRLEEGIFAVENLCPHCMKDIGKAPVVVEEAVTCPTHGWTLDVIKGECPVNPDQPFATYPARIEKNRILLEI